MAKTDWGLNDVVQPSDMNAIGEEINQNAADIASQKTYVDEHLAEKVAKTDLAATTAGKGASLVGIQDATGLFASTNAEGALREAMEKANSAFQSASDGKTAVAAAITGKGVAASGSDTFPVLAQKIGQINTGKRSSSGTYTTDLSRTIRITGLSFSPTLIIFYMPTSADRTGIAQRVLSMETKFISSDTTYWGTFTITWNSDGAVLVTVGNSIAANSTYNWVAIE